VRAALCNAPPILSRAEGASPPRHCEERSDAAIQLFLAARTGLLRFARNDGLADMVNRPVTIKAHPL